MTQRVHRRCTLSSYKLKNKQLRSLKPLIERSEQKSHDDLDDVRYRAYLTQL
jgi:hypothetical protein